MTLTKDINFIWRIFIQILQALKVIHSNNIILKNLNPLNIFLDKNNNAKIGSFDMMYEFHEEYLFQENEDVLSYISPEILNGFPYNNKCDVWSFGCILFELVFKRRAFNYYENNINIVRREFKTPDNCNKNFKIILSKLLCEENKRLALNEIIYDWVVKKQLIDENLFDEILIDKEKIKCKPFLYLHF